MTAEQQQIERSYDVPGSAAWPDLTSLPGVRAVEPAGELELTAVYYDTAPLTLARAGITLRRRTSGPEAGWQLSLPPSGVGPTEIGAPATTTNRSTRVPTELREQARAWVRGRALRPVATLHTHRLVHRLLGADGRVLAEVTDDVVTSDAAGNPGTAAISNWREWTVRLIDGRGKLLTAADATVTAAGGTLASWPSPVHHALGRPARGADPTTRKLSPKAPAGRVLHAHLAGQVAELLSRDALVRVDAPDAVHKMRVATRRLRSALSTFRPLVDRAVTDPLRDELTWLAALLGGARDAEVQRVRLLDAIAAEPADLVLGPIAARVEVELQADHRAALDQLAAGMASTRYFRLLDELDALSAAPPFTALADQPAAVGLTKRVQHAFRTLRKLERSGAPDDPMARDHWYHEMRKAAKKLRYAAEAVAPAFGAPATTFAAAVEDLQELLGTHQDSVVARRLLRAMAVRLFLDGENPFTLGRLHAQEEANARAAEAEFPAAWAAAADPQLRRWLRG